MTALFYVLTALCAYFLGGINGAIITSKYLFRKDVRKYGSGNAGLTNFFRTFGLAGVALVLFVDIAKSVLAVLIGKGLLGVVGEPTLGGLFAGFFLIVGHFYPAFYQFHGGKGVLCAVMVAIMTNWQVGLLCFAVFLMTVVLTRYISLGSVLGTLSFLPLLLLFGYRDPIELLLALMCAAAVVLKHSPNIKRLLNGTESKIKFKKAAEQSEK